MIWTCGIHNIDIYIYKYSLSFNLFNLVYSFHLTFLTMPTYACPRTCMRCWHPDARQRPQFSDICSMLADVDLAALLPADPGLQACAETATLLCVVARNLEQ